MKHNLQRLALLIFFLSLSWLNAATITVNAAGGANYTTIQDAINAANPGDVIQVASGTYSENLTISLAITLEGANANLDFGSRVAESSISPASGTAITVTSDGVTINGFEITGTNSNYAILCGNTSNLDISFNYIHSIGTALTGGNIHAIQYTVSNGSSTSDVSITDNKFENISSSSLSGSSASAIGILQSTSTGTLTTLSIERNIIDQVNVNTLDWPTGKIAYGIQINVGGSSSNFLTNGKVVGAIISDNVISHLSGFISTAIALEGNTENAYVSGNTISNLYGRKSAVRSGGGYDLNGLKFEYNRYVGTCTVTDNIFRTDTFDHDGTLGLGYAIANYVSEADGGVADVSCNWFGTSDPFAVADNNNLDGKILNKANCTTEFLPISSSDSPINCDGTGPIVSNNGNTYLTIEDAINDAAPGDSISFSSGTYDSFSITADGVILVGNGATIRNGSPAISVSSNNVVIDGFTFAYNTADTAIVVTGDYSGIVVKNCTFNNFDGGGVNPGFGIGNEYKNTLGYILDATENNVWNGNGEPYNATTNPTGTGVTISQYVQFNALTLLSPVNSLSGVSIKPKMTWDLIGASSYKVQIASSTDFVTDLVAEQTASGGQSFSRFSGYDDTDIPLANNTKYFWRVVADFGATTVTSSTYYFTTVSNVNISLWNPGSGMQLYQYSPATMSWSINQATGSLKFYVQFFEQQLAPDYAQIASFESTNADNIGGNSTLYYENISDVYKSISDLSGGQKYYWFVCAYYDDGSTPNVLDFDDRIVSYSALVNFTTTGGAVSAYPSWPVGGPLYSLEPTFYWYTMQYEPSANYTVMYSTDPTMVGDSLTVGVTEVYAGSNTYIGVGTTLDASQTYYWQVRTRYGNTYSYSSVASFTTYDAPGLVPTAANLSYPTGGLEIYTTAPTFYWWTGGSGTSVNYEVQLSTNGGTSWTLSFPPTTSNYVQGSGLKPGQSYTWRVRSYITGPDEVFSTYGEFSVTGGLNSYPVASWPVGNPTIYSATPTLSWYMEGSTLGWTHYKVGWSKKPQADWVAFITTNQAGSGDSSNVTSDMNETFYTFTSPLDYGSKYYWAVVAHDHPSGPYSDVAEGSFTIAGNDANVVQLNPSNNLITNTKSPTFTWYVSGSLLGVTHFRLTYSKTELFNAFVETVVTTTTSASVNAPLELGTTYWWYVELSYDNGATFVNPSSTWKFTVDPGASSVVPFAGSPARGITISSTSPVLSWYLPAQSTSALSYDIEIADNANFANAKVYNDVSTLNNKVETLPEGEYFWRVRSKTASNQSDYSAAASFKIGTVTDVSDQEEIPLSFSIDQNYPNPFNPSTTINYSIPNASFVTIKVYNMLGQEVKTLVNKEVAAGRFTVAWNGDNNYGSKVSSGTYIYQIISGNFVQSRKMILLK